MLRYLGLLILPLLLLATPASALTAKQKMETCKIGATAEKLTGAKRAAFIKKCMAKGPARHRAKKPTAKKLATKPHRLTAKEKKETCEIGATAEKLTGAKRKAFIRKCMAKGDYEPAARKEAIKKAKAMKRAAAKKKAAKKKAAMKPARKKPEQKK